MEMINTHVTLIDFNCVCLILRFLMVLGSYKVLTTRPFMIIFVSHSTS